MEKEECLFNKETLLAESKHLKIYVVQIFTKRQKQLKSAAQDHQYKLYLKKESEGPISKNILLEVLAKAILLLLQKFESFYATEDEKTVYLTTMQHNCYNAFSLLPFVLQKNNSLNKTEKVANDIINYWSTSFVSKEDQFKIENDLFVLFKII
jgi:hypothetical protein